MKKKYIIALLLIPTIVACFWGWTQYKQGLAIEKTILDALRSEYCHCSSSFSNLVMSSDDDYLVRSLADPKYAQVLLDSVIFFAESTDAFSSTYSFTIQDVDEFSTSSELNFRTFEDKESLAKRIQAIEEFKQVLKGGNKQDYLYYLNSEVFSDLSEKQRVFLSSINF
jgi:hypothetical protein